MMKVVSAPTLNVSGCAVSGATTGKWFLDTLVDHPWLGRFYLSDLVVRSIMDAVESVPREMYLELTRLASKFELRIAELEERERDAFATESELRRQVADAEARAESAQANRDAVVRQLAEAKTPSDPAGVAREQLRADAASRAKDKKPAAKGKR